MTCALCLRDNELQQSHIIPEFLYGAMYDDKHRFNVLTILPGEKDRIAQKGLREQLLCRGCELAISRLERYASLVIKGGALGVDGNRQGDVVSVTGIDYAKFNSFLCQSCGAPVSLVIDTSREFSWARIRNDLGPCSALKTQAHLICIHPSSLALIGCQARSPD